MKQIFVIFILLMGTLSMAQMDPNAWISSDTASSKASEKGTVSSSDGLDTQRYVKKPKASKKIRHPASEDDFESPSPIAPAAPGRPSMEGDAQNSLAAPLTRRQMGPQPDPHAPSQEVQGAPQNLNNPDRVPPTFGNKVRDLFLGGDPEMIDQYRSFLDTEDIRKNIFEFTLATSYLYDTSLSPYFYRNYLDSAPTAFVGLELWITPFIGIDTDYRSTLLDSVNDSQTQNNFVNVNHTWFDLGIHFRRFFGMAAHAANLTVGLRYADYAFSVPKSAQTKMSVHDQAPELTLDMTMPATRNYSWTLGLSLQPYVTQTESIGNTDFRSGQGNQTVEFGASVGGEYRMSRQTRAFFKFSTTVYKSQFSGAANGIDPITGITPSNVPVTNVFYMFDLGVKLGR